MVTSTSANIATIHKPRERNSIDSDITINTAQEEEEEVKKQEMEEDELTKDDSTQIRPGSYLSSAGHEDVSVASSDSSIVSVTRSIGGDLHHHSCVYGLPPPPETPTEIEAFDLSTWIFYSNIAYSKPS
eukprot:7397551-Ditylum_brightwellii.AAC.1